MKNNKILTFAMIIGFSLFCNSCKDDEPDMSWTKSELSQKLIGTQWQLYSIVDYWSDGTETGRSDRLRPQIFYYSSEPYENYSVDGLQMLKVSYYDTDTGETRTAGWCIDGNYLHTGLNLAPMGTIVTLTPTEFKVRYDYATTAEEAQKYGCFYSIWSYKLPD